MATNGPTSIKLRGAVELAAALKELPEIADTKVLNPGLSKGASRMRTLMRTRARRISKTGTLVKSIIVKRVRFKNKGRTNLYRVGLLTRQYYKVLDVGRKSYTRKSGHSYAGTSSFDSEGVGIEETWNMHKETIAQLIVDTAQAALAKEVGKLYAKRMFRRS